LYGIARFYAACPNPFQLIELTLACEIFCISDLALALCAKCIVIVGRFAPSTTGQAHPGTLLSALLVWLDGRSKGGRILLRLEDIDPQRCKPQWAAQLQDAMQWLGLPWDAVSTQSDNRTTHDSRMMQLARTGRLYACSCSRARLREGRRAADGSRVYDNQCRFQILSPSNWQACSEPIRFNLLDHQLDIHDESGIDLSQIPAAEMGDPIIRRRDGAYSYQFAVVVDDADAGINRVVRGRDIAPSTATQVAIYQALQLRMPVYRHHFLLLERRVSGAELPMKLAKLHGSIPLNTLRNRYTGPGLVGVLAWAAGLQSEPAPMSPSQLLLTFDWRRVQSQDLVCDVDATGTLSFSRHS
jgi:glutamyl-Q tRNA(Asp) synthetase